MKAVISCFVVGLSLIAAACGGGKSTPGDDDDTPPTDGGGSDGPAACTVDESYAGTAVTAQPGSYTCPDAAGCAITAADQIFVDGAINGGADLLSIELYQGFGAYETAIVTGQVELTGDEANYGSCGACVVMYTDTDGDNVQFYMATGGTLNITSLTPTITGTITNATFTHATVNMDTLESTPVGDCESAATGTYTFSVAATEDTGGQ